MIQERRSYILLECLGGPMDGTVVAAAGKEFVVGTADGVGQLYVREGDDTGAPYWEYRGPAID